MIGPVRSLAALSMFLTLMFTLPLPLDAMDPAEEVGPGVSTRGGIPPEFDVQFILDPEDDPLAPFFGEKHAYLEPGSRAHYWVLISNLGDEEETYIVDLSAPPEDTGFNWFFDDTGGQEIAVTLRSAAQRDEEGGKSFEVFLATVIVPSDALVDLGSMRIEVSAATDRDIKLYGTEATRDSDDLTIDIQNIDGIKIPSGKERIFHVDPGEWITYPIAIHNLGNKDVITVRMAVDEDDQWRTTYRDFEDIYYRKYHILDYNWVQTEVLVEQGKKVYMNISARVPEHFADDDDVFQFRVIGRIVGSSFWSTSDVVTLIVDRATELHADPGWEGRIPIVPGVGKGVKLLIWNTYWKNDVIEGIALLDPEGIGLTVNMEPDEAEGILVPGNGNVGIPLVLLADEDHPMGPVDLRLEVRPKYSPTFFLNLTLDVQRRVDMSILPTGPISSGNVTISPGEEKEIVLGVRNDGNSASDVVLGLNGTVPTLQGPEGPRVTWSYRISWVSQVREPGDLIALGADEMPLNASKFEDELGHTLLEGSWNEPIPLRIPPGETMWVAAEIFCPDGYGLTMVADHAWTVNLSDDKGSVLDEFEVMFHPVYSDLVLDGMLVLRDANGRPIRSIDEGGRVHFNVNVTNEGVCFSEPTEMDLVSDHEVVCMVQVPSLAPGEAVRLEGNFTAKEGMRQVELRLDPRNTVVESDDQYMVGSTEDANVLRAPISIVSRDPDRWDLFWALGLLYLIAVIFLSVLSMIRVHRRVDR